MRVWRFGLLRLWGYPWAIPIYSFLQWHNHQPRRYISTPSMNKIVVLFCSQLFLLELSCAGEQDHQILRAWQGSKGWVASSAEVPLKVSTWWCALELCSWFNCNCPTYKPHVQTVACGPGSTVQPVIDSMDLLGPYYMFWQINASSWSCLSLWFYDELIYLILLVNVCIHVLFKPQTILQMHPDLHNAKQGAPDSERGKDSR